MARTTAGRPHASDHNFAKIPTANIPRSSFKRTHNIKTTLNSAGYLYPFFIEDVVPGDTVKLKATLFGRVATLLQVPMDNIYLDVFWFSCSERLLWDNFKRMMGEQDNPADSTSYILPVVRSPANGFPFLGLADYFGIPPQHSVATGGATLDVRAAPFRMYNRLWNEHFRDENIQNSVTLNMGNGPDASTDYVLLQRGKRKDYFTSCLPWPQKGTAVLLPLGTQAPISGLGLNANLTVTTENSVRQTDGTTSSFTNAIDLGTAANVGATVMRVKTNSATAFPDVYADLSAATAATINQIRTAFQIQRLYERDARGGTRYPEQVLAHFGVTSPDSRQQRVEFLGGGTLNLSINPVPRTVPSAGGGLGAGTDGFVGQLGSFGTIVGGVPTIIKSFTEHSWVMGLVMARADLNYQQGLAKMWSKSTKVDLYWPALAMLGEQAVLSQELYLDGDNTASGNPSVFGYQERWAEMRYKPNQITGQMRSTYTTPLDSWHLAQKFTSRPLLNATFIVENPPMTRIQAYATPSFILDGFIDFIHTRPMPTFSVPGLIDHF